MNDPNLPDTGKPSNTSDQHSASDGPSPPPHRSKIGKILRCIKKRQVEIGIIVLVLTLLSSTLIPLLVPVVEWLLPGGEGEKVETVVTGELVNFVPRVKRAGLDPWGGQVAVPKAGGPIEFGMRIENTGTQAITGLAVRISIPGAISMIPGKCHYGVNRSASMSCSSSIVDDGVALPSLEPDDWVQVICKADVSGDALGGSYPATLKMISDQTEEAIKTVTVELPTTSAERAVRGLFETTEEETELWDGAPEMAHDSEGLLIEQWPEFTLEHSHSYVELPRGKAVTLEDLAYDHTLGGQLVELRAQVIGRPREYPAGPGMVKQSLELGVSGIAARLLCYTPRPMGMLFEAEDHLEVKAVVIAWGSQTSSASNELTMGICPAARVSRRGPQPLNRPPRPVAAREWGSGR